MLQGSLEFKNSSAPAQKDEKTEYIIEHCKTIDCIDTSQKNIEDYDTIGDSEFDGLSKGAQNQKNAADKWMAFRTVHHHQVRLTSRPLVAFDMEWPRRWSHPNPGSQPFQSP